MSQLTHEVAKVLEFQLQFSPSNEHPGLISFRMDWLDFLEVQGTLKSLLQHHSSKASILRHSAFFTIMVYVVLYLLCLAVSLTWSRFLKHLDKFLPP